MSKRKTTQPAREPDVFMVVNGGNYDGQGRYVRRTADEKAALRRDYERVKAAGITTRFRKRLPAHNALRRIEAMGITGFRIEDGYLF